MANLNFERNGPGVLISFSDSPPSHYILKIKSFSLLKTNSLDAFQSGEFKAGGYKWKLMLHPNGNKKKDVEDHNSLYLEMAGSKLFKPGWEVYVFFRLFLPDQNNGTYWVLEGTLQTDILLMTRVFGAEVFVFRETRRGKGECLSMIKNAVMSKYVWKIEKFSMFDAKSYSSEPFTAGSYKWVIRLFPKGNGKGKGSHLSLLLALANPNALPPGSRLFAVFSLRIIDQGHGRDRCCRSNHWFSASSSTWGWATFSKLVVFRQAGRGFLMNDTCLVDAEVTVQGITQAQSA